MTTTVQNHGINYTEATRRTFEALGWDCGTDAMMRHLKIEYGIKMNRATCSVYRSKMRQKHRAEQEKATEMEQLARECPDIQSDIDIVALADLHALRDLSRRHGKQTVLELAGLFA